MIGISEDENQRGRTEEILKTIFQENTPEIKKCNWKRDFRRAQCIHENIDPK